MPSPLTERLPERLRDSPLATMRSDSDLDAIADAVAATAFTGDEPLFKATGKHLLLACLGYLRDWCEPEQRTMESLGTLLAGALPAPGGDGYRTALGDLFYEIESGCRRVPGTDGEADSWEPTGLVRADGISPRDTNGIRPADDFSLGCYRRFVRSASPATRTSVALSLSDALPREGAVAYGG